MDYEQQIMDMDTVWWVIGIVVLLFAFFFIPVSRRRKKSRNALDILQKEYASGKMTTQEYEERKAILQKDEMK